MFVFTLVVIVFLLHFTVLKIFITSECRCALQFPATYSSCRLLEELCCRYPIVLLFSHLILLNFSFLCQIIWLVRWLYNFNLLNIIILFRLILFILWYVIRYHINMSLYMCKNWMNLFNPDNYWSYFLISSCKTFVLQCANKNMISYIYCWCMVNEVKKMDSLDHWYPKCVNVWNLDCRGTLLLNYQLSGCVFILLHIDRYTLIHIITEVVYINTHSFCCI